MMHNDVNLSFSIKKDAQRDSGTVEFQCSDSNNQSEIKQSNRK